LPSKAIELLTLYARQANEETIEEKAAS